MTTDDATAVLEAVLDELAAAQAHTRKAAWTDSELEELAEEGEVGRAELAAAFDALAAEADRGGSGARPARRRARPRPARRRTTRG